VVGIVDKPRKSLVNKRVDNALNVLPRYPKCARKLGHGPRTTGNGTEHLPSSLGLPDGPCNLLASVPKRAG
jgi:hypothetical protein